MTTNGFISLHEQILLVYRNINYCYSNIKELVNRELGCSKHKIINKIGFDFKVYYFVVFK